MLNNFTSRNLDYNSIYLVTRLGKKEVKVPVEEKKG